MGCNLLKRSVYSSHMTATIVARYIDYDQITWMIGDKILLTTLAEVPASIRGFLHPGFRLNVEIIDDQVTRWDV